MVNARSRLLPVLCVSLFLAADVGAQPRVGALAIDEGQGDHYGGAVDHQTAAAAREAALRECGAGCSVVLTFDRCGAYAADQDNAATAFGWGENRMPRRMARDSARCRSAARVAGRGAWLGFGATTLRWSRRGWPSIEPHGGRSSRVSRP